MMLTFRGNRMIPELFLGQRHLISSGCPPALIRRTTGLVIPAIRERIGLRIRGKSFILISASVPSFDDSQTPSDLGRSILKTHRPG